MPRFPQHRILLGCPGRLGSVGCNPNIRQLFVGELTHWSILILTIDPIFLGHPSIHFKKRIDLGSFFHQAGWLFPMADFEPFWALWSVGKCPVEMERLRCCGLKCLYFFSPCRPNPYHLCIKYLPTLMVVFLMVNIVKYTSPMEKVGQKGSVCVCV